MASGGQTKTFDPAYFQHISEDLYNELIDIGVSHEQLLMMEERRRQSEEQMTPENFPYLTAERIDLLRESGQNISMFRKENEFKRREVEEQLKNLTMHSTQYPNMRHVNHNELRVLMLGKTGSGKTATADTLCGRNGTFKAHSGSQSGTKGLMEALKEICGQKIRVMDTPGLFDTSMTNEDVLNIISTVITHWHEGIHAFLYVINYAWRRFTEEERKTFELIREHFGKTFESHCVVVFTHADLLLTDKHDNNDPMTLQTYYDNERKLSTDTAKFLACFKERIIAIDNSNSLEPVIKRNREVLLQLVQQASDAGSRVYTNEFFKEAQRQKANRRRDRGREHIHKYLDEALIQELSFIDHPESQTSENTIASIQDVLHGEGYNNDEENYQLIEEVMEDERNVFRKVLDAMSSWLRQKAQYVKSRCTVM